MSGQVQWDRAAEADVDAIWDFVAQKNIFAANRLIKDIFDTCARIAERPLMGEARPELGRALRCFSSGSYVIFFRPMRDGIGVARILHGARDVDRQF